MLQGYIYIEKTPIGGIGAPVAKKEHKCSINGNFETQEGHTNVKQKPLCCKYHSWTSLKVLILVIQIWRSYDQMSEMGIFWLGRLIPLLANETYYYMPFICWKIEVNIFSQKSVFWLPWNYIQNLSSPRALIRVQPKFVGKLGLEIWVYQKAPPIGGNFGEVSESLLRKDHLCKSGITQDQGSSPVVLYIEHQELLNFLPGH